MITAEMETSLRGVLSIEDEHERNCSFILALIKIGSDKELEDVRAFFQGLPSELRSRVAFDEDINFEIQLRKQWISHMEIVDSTLSGCPSLAERVEGVGHKVAILQFAKFCACEIDFVCKLLEDIIEQFGLGSSYVAPRSDVLSALAFQLHNSCWILRKLFLSEMIDPVDTNHGDAGNVHLVPKSEIG